ncbi:response regulator [Insolitispirillum peregrinum]|uniref:response regulator n=1 Tax=Insolitispirillum peregrinum TaxID=80876 RepID=UPI00361894F0
MDYMTFCTFSFPGLAIIMATLSVLLIEDDSGDALLARMALEEQTYTSSLTTRTTGREALDFLTTASSCGHPVDLVLLDGSLSDCSGLDILKAIRSIPYLENLPVVMLTGSSSPALKTAFMDHGASRVIEKSGDFDQLVASLAHLPDECLQKTAEHQEHVF